MLLDEILNGLQGAPGMESVLGTGEMTEYDEMKEELADLAAMESAFEEMEACSVLAAIEEVNSIGMVLACREVGLESVQGSDKANIFKSFGVEDDIAMEAAKDVLARKAYAGVAAIKALIATCIKWLKNLLGFTVASKKVFSSLAKKGKAMKKDLEKKRSSKKIDAEKLKREVPQLTESLDTFVKLYDKHFGKIKDGDEASVKKTLSSTVDQLKDATQKFKDDQKEYSDKYDKSNTTEKSGSELYTYMVNFCGALETIKTDRTEDVGKKLKKAIKNLEDYQKSLDRDSKENKDNSDSNENAKQILSAKITYYNVLHGVVKSDLKYIVRIADDGLTMAKGVLAAIY